MNLIVWIPFSLDSCEMRIWRSNLPFDFKIQNKSLLFSFDNFKSINHIRESFFEAGQYPKLDIKNYYFWLNDKYLFVVSNESNLIPEDENYDNYFCFGLTSCDSPFYNDYSILELNDNNEWCITYFENCEVAEKWLNCRFNNVIDILIKRELFLNNEINRECLIAPNYDTKINTLYKGNWTINPSYANDLSYSTLISDGGISHTLIFNEELLKSYFNPIRSYLYEYNLSHCYVCFPKFSLCGDSLSIRLEHTLCKLRDNGDIYKEPVG